VTTVDDRLEVMLYEDETTWLHLADELEKTPEYLKQHEENLEKISYQEEGYGTSSGTY